MSPCVKHNNIWYEFPSFQRQNCYHKTIKIGTPELLDVITGTLKFEQCGFTKQQCLQIISDLGLHCLLICPCLSVPNFMTFMEFGENWTALKPYLISFPNLRLYKISLEVYHLVQCSRDIGVLEYLQEQHHTTAIVD